MRDIKPMGALGLPKGKEKLESLYADSNYVAEKKFDGSRYTLQKYSNKIYLQSRRESVDGGMCDKTDRVPHIVKEALELREGTILDGEIDILDGRDFHYVQGCMGSLTDRAIKIQKENQMLYYKVFDILEFLEEDLRNKTLKYRRAILEEIFANNKFKYIKLVEQITDEQEKRKLFEEEIEKGGEGIILKNLNSFYHEGKKTVNSWYKIKLVNTYDGIILGYNPGTGKYSGMVGSLITYQYVNNILTPVADCGGMTDELRKEFKTKLDNGERFIIEFKAQEPEGTNRYRHPRYLRIREDKNERDCIYKEK